MPVTTAAEMFLDTLPKKQRVAIAKWTDLVTDFMAPGWTRTMSFGAEDVRDIVVLVSSPNGGRAQVIVDQYGRVESTTTGREVDLDGR